MSHLETATAAMSAARRIASDDTASSPRTRRSARSMAASRASSSADGSAHSHAAGTARLPIAGRTAILAAGERVFAERGYEGASLADIAELAGVSRATPSYFFGSKEDLYVAVLEQVFQDRQSAAVVAFEPLHAWARGEGDRDAL